MIGAGAGLSTSAGLTYSGERFTKTFGDFQAKYGVQDMYSGGFYPFETLEEPKSQQTKHDINGQHGLVCQPHPILEHATGHGPM